MAKEAKYRVTNTHIFEGGKSVLHGDMERPEKKEAQVVTKAEVLAVGISEERFVKLVKTGALEPLEGLQDEAADEVSASDDDADGDKGNPPEGPTNAPTARDRGVENPPSRNRR